MLELLGTLAISDQSTGSPLTWQQVLFSPLANEIYGLGSDYRVRMWDVKSTRLMKIIGQTSDWIQTMALSPDGKLLAVGSTDHWIALWDLASEQQWYYSHEPDNSVLSITFSTDGKFVASGDADGTIVVWDIARKEVVSKYSNGYGWAQCIRFSLDGKTLFSGSIEHYSDNKITGTLRAWDRETREASLVIPMPSPIESIAVSPDGSAIAVGSWNPEISVLDTATAGVNVRLVGHKEKVLAVSYRPNHTALCSGSQDATVRLWDTLSGRELAVVEGHAGPVTSVAFSHDGTLLASASDDHNVKVWAFGS